MIRFRSRIWLLTIVFAVLILSGGKAFSSMIINGNFDTFVPSNGTGGGWTSLNIDSAGGWRSSGGNPGAQFIINDNGLSSRDPIISQSVSGFDIGTTYILSWDLALHVNFSGGGTGTSFGVFLDGSPLLLTEFLGSGWQGYGVRFDATNTSHVISFAAELDPRTPGVSKTTDVSYRIDNVNLQVVPIPAGLWLLGSGVIALIGFRKKFRKN